MECSLPGSSVHGISQARILGWVAISFLRESSQSRDGTHISYFGGWISYPLTPKEAQVLIYNTLNLRISSRCLKYYQAL